VTPRPLHAVLFPPEPGGGRLLELLSAALDGTGPAILPLDPELPGPRLRDVLAGFGAAAVHAPEGTRRLSHPAAAGKGTAGPGTAGLGTGGLAVDTAVVVATSGSTGRPKGVQLSAAALTASAAASLDRIGARPGGRWLCCLPGFHVAGLQVLVRSLLAGSSPVVAARADAAVIADCGCDYVSLVPTQLRRLLDAGAPLAGLGAILLGGAAPPAGLLADAAAAGARVITTYGMSETCGGCVYDGLPLAGVRLRTGPGGLIGIAGPVLFSGYWPVLSSAQPSSSSAMPSSPAASAGQTGGRPPSGGTAGDDGWFWTSDLGEIDGGGRLTVRGRADDVINSGGEKVIPGEVETVLGTFPGVRDVVVIGVPDPEWGEAVTAVIVPADQAAPPQLPRLRAQARELLPGYAAPRRLLVLSEIPVLASGKPDRQALRQIAARSGA
jgi:O-succinylbenzoic acid--CoA ligase